MDGEGADAGRLALRRAFRDRRRRGAELGLPHASGRHRLQAARRPLCVRAQRQLDQGQVPGRPGGGDRRLDQRGRQPAALPDRRGEPRRPAGPRRPHRHRLRPRQGRPDPAAPPGGGDRQVPVRRPEARRRRRPACTGRSPCWWPRSSSAAGPAPATCARPRFKGLREDKPAEEVVQETVARGRGGRAGQAAGTKPSPKAKPTGNVIMGVTLSSPDKVLWPAADGEPDATKRDLALYLRGHRPRRSCAHIKGRPCSIIRLPGRDRRPELLPAPHRQGHLEPGHLGRGVRRQASPISRSTASRP